MRTCPFDLSKATALARIVSIVASNRSLYFTDAQQDVTIDGQLYVSEPGCMASTISYNNDGTVANSEIIVSSDTDGQLKPQDATFGFYDGATVVMSLIDPTQPTAGAMRLLSGYIGNIKETREGMVSFEARSVLMRARSIVMEAFGPMCRANFGDDRCKMPALPADIARNTAYILGDPRNYDHVNSGWGRVRIGSAGDPSDYQNFVWQCTQAGTTAGSAPVYSGPLGNEITDGTAKFTATDSWTRYAKIDSIVNNHSVFLDRQPDPRDIDGWYSQGVLILRSGLNFNVSLPISNYVQSGHQVLFFLDISEIIVGGEWIEIITGCNKQPTTCFSKFDNIKNAREEEFVPGRDLALTNG